MLRAYPDLRIAYLEEEQPKKEGGVYRIFSSPGHPLNRPFQFILVVAKHFHNLGDLDTLKQLEGPGVVHHTGDCPERGLFECGSRHRHLYGG